MFERLMEEKPKIDFSALSENEQVLYLYSEGGGDAEICKALQISKEEFDEKHKSDSHFRKLISFGRTLALAFWEELIRELAQAKRKGEINAIKLIMQNRYGWSEKSTTENKGAFSIENMTKDQVEQELRKFAPTIANIMEQKQKH